MDLSKHISRLLIISVALFSFTCKEPEIANRVYASIDTKPVTEINESGATFNAEILSVGEAGISDHGFVYGDTYDPVVGKSDQISLGEIAQKGPISAVANRSLSKDRKYYVKAYTISKNANFIVYGQQMEFTSIGSTAPEIVDFTPKQGVIGDTLLLTGRGFSNVVANNRISFGTITTQPIKSTQDSIWCVVPAETEPGESQLGILLGQFNVKAKSNFLLKPAGIVSFSPASISFGDTVNVTGVNFPRRSNLAVARILGKSASVISISANQLKAIAATDMDITASPVELKIGTQTVTSTESISLQKPVINNFTPQKGTKNTEVTINGAHFSPIYNNNKVSLNTAALPVILATKTSVKVKIPTGLVPGSYPFTVTIAGQSTASSTEFEIIEPVITSISPLSGTWGTTVTISGKNFGLNPSDNVVLFGSIQATVINSASTELKVQVPNNLLNKSSIISVKALTVDNLSATFTSSFLLNAPLISNFAPVEGKSNSLVTINGQNFNPIAANQIVKFGDKVATVVSSSSDQLVVRLPTSLADDNVSIKIELAEQQFVSGSTFHTISPWRKLADFPSNPRADAVAFTIGSYGYVGLGTKSNIFAEADTWKYDVQNNSWEKIAGFYYSSVGGSGSYVNLTSFVISDEAYVGMGSIGGAPQGPRMEFSKYTPLNNEWNVVAPSIDGLEGPVGYAINNKGYVVTGRSYPNQPDFRLFQYDPSTNSWSRKADFPGSPRTEASGFSIGDKAYITTGLSNITGILFKDLWSYSPSLDKWSQLSSLPGSVRWQATSFSVNGMGYVIGGASTYDTYYSRLNDIWMYDPSVDKWTQLEDFPGEARAGAVAFTIGGKAYFGTGLGGPAIWLNDFWEFDPTKL